MHITFAKLSNIDYQQYMYYEGNLTNFTTFINNIINFKKRKIKNLEKFFDIIDSHIKNQLKTNEKRGNFLKSFLRFFFGYNLKEDIFEKYKINYISPFVEIFKKELKKINLINDNYDFDDEKINKIEEYAKKYLYLKDHLKENEYYIKSFYEDFYNKVKHIMSYSEGIKKRKLSYYLNDLISQAHFQNI